MFEDTKGINRSYKTKTDNKMSNRKRTKRVISMDIS